MSPPPSLCERLSELTLALCNIPSVTGAEHACADFVEARLRQTPLAVERLGACVIARGPARGRPLVTLLGHLDTVPPKSGDQAPRIEGTKIIGLGASDMKSGLAVMLALSEQLDLSALAYDLGLVFYDREEGPWAESGLGPVLEQVGWIRETTLGFCLEPSDNVVQVGCLGSLHATVRVGGRSAHSARPWQGHNAIHAAGPLLTALAARQPVEVDCGGYVFREVLSATLAQGGIGRNVIPDAFSLNLNYRFAPGKSVETACADVLSFVAAHAPSATVDFTDRAPSGRVVTDNPLLQRFLAATGASIAPKQAWTDVARLSAVGIDAVNLGPGASAQAHQAGEWVEATRIAEGYQQFAMFLGGRS